MSQKETCPGCNSHTSDVAAAFRSDDPCPNCGLSAAAAREIMSVRGSMVERAVSERFEELRLRADRAEATAKRFGECLDAICEAIEEMRREDVRAEQDRWRQ